jgi:predicted ribosome quality control (RQC) complex YloA/Tae2 family protein
MKTKLEPKIAELYALPLDEFTNARNALAKTLSGAEKKQVASLVKPSLSMWVVNQLYWRDAPTYKARVDASEKLRTAHRAALNGRKADTSAAGELHRTTLETAFAKAAALAQKNGVSLTDPVRDAVRRTLAALPTDEAPGRLTREPPPVGFSLLTGVKPRAVETKPSKRSEKEPPRAVKVPSAQDLQRQKFEEKRRKAAEAESRKQEERARKEREKREREIKKAEQALRDAERRLAELKR